MAGKEELKNKVTDTDTAEIAKVSPSLEKLSPYLNITPAEWEEIQRDNPKDYYLQKRGLLGKWKVKNGEDATYENLIAAAKKFGNMELVHGIETRLGKI